MTTPYTPASASAMQSNQSRRFGAKPEPPRISPRTESHATILVHGVNDVGAKVYRLFFEARNGAPQTWVAFRNDDVAVQAVFEREFPNGLQGPEYKALIDWRVKWHTVGGKPVADEIDVTPRIEGEMTNQPTAPASELDEFLGRGKDEPPAEDKPAKKCASWVNDPKLRGAFFQAYKGMCNRYNVPEEEVEPIRKVTLIELCEADSLKAYLGTQTELLSALEKQIQGQGYKPAETPNATATKSEPQTGQNPVVSNIPPEPPANAVAGKSDGKKDASVNDTPIDKKDEIRAKYNKPQRGNDYLMVQGRVLLLRLEHPDWTIETDMIGMTDDAAVFKATIRNAEGRIIATGHGRATEAKTNNLGGRFLEKAETASIGRALALAGFGTDSSLDDADYLADSPVAKAA